MANVKLWACLLSLVACNSVRGGPERRGAPGPQASPLRADEQMLARKNDSGPIRIEALSGVEPPVFAHRGGPRGPGMLVFLHGMCGHGMGYAQSFQFAAAKYGTLIAPQGDVVCGQGPWAKWSRDLDALDRRIAAGFRAAGILEPVQDVVLIGYSMGATRALELASKFPERYTRVISMGAPTAPTPGGVPGLRGAVMMAGERDRQDQMRAGAKAFQRAGIPATFQLIPEAQHGAMGPTPEQTMREALDWLAEHQKSDVGGASAGKNVD